MKSLNFKNPFRLAVMLLGVFSITMISSCKEDEIVEDPIASFQYEISQDNYLMVAFTNFSQNAETYLWNFGDGQTSTEQNPTHTYTQVGNYTVTLTATNKVNVSHVFEEAIEIKDPFEALTLLAGQTSKTWRLYRVGTSMGVGPNAEQPRIWWSLENDGTRPCIYFHEFTFNRQMQFIFDHKGYFWGEGGVFRPDLVGQCLEAVPSNMVGPDGQNLSAWLNANHQFTYDAATNVVTLNGNGAWMGLPKLGINGEVTVPQTSVSFKINITQETGYDLMIVLFQYNDFVWEFSYASYSDPSLEPAVVTAPPPAFGTDLPDITPTELSHTFESAESYKLLGAIGGTSVITVGQDDPASGTTKVGRFERVAGEQWQEAQLRTAPDLYDIQFDNFTKAKIDIFIPASTTFAEGGLQRHMVFGFADLSQTQEWWNSPVQFVVSGNDLVVGEWKTYEFNLTDVKARNDLDMIYLGIGGGGHGAGGIFYVRNLIFE